MATNRPQSTISYNTRDFLLETLDDLYTKHIIKAWYCIEHMPEEDESKKHWHVYLEPNGRIDVMDLGENFIQLLSDEKLPRKCINFCSSNLDDWILYVLHYQPYLEWKMQSRKLHYSADEIIKFDDMQFEFDFHHAFYESDFARAKQKGQLIKVAVDNDPAKLFYEGRLKLNEAPSMLALQKLDRNYRVTHTPLANDEFVANKKLHDERLGVKDED